MNKLRTIDNREIAVFADRLIFIYNADGGLARGLIDAVHKTLSPATYPCSLCAITYGAVAMKARWRDWLKALPMESVFYHRDDSPFPGVTLPVVMVERAGRVETLIDAATLNAIADLDTFIAELESRL